MVGGFLARPGTTFDITPTRIGRKCQASGTRRISWEALENFPIIGIYDQANLLIAWIRRIYDENIRTPTGDTEALVAAILKFIDDIAWVHFARTVRFGKDNGAGIIAAVKEGPREELRIRLSSQSRE
jgi:hypothetical protein